MSTEQQLQDQLIQKSIENNAKDMESLQKLGEELGKKNQKEALKTANDVMNKTNTTTSNGSNSYVYPKSMQIINATLMLAILIIIPIILMRMASKKKDKSIFAKFSFHYFKLSIMGSLLFYIGNLINIFNPSIIKDYILIVIVIIGAYLFSKIKKKGIKKSSKIESGVEKGVVIGSTNNKLIIKPPEKPGNLLVVGAPGKGKSVNIIIPSLLNWEGSAVVLDIKREIYAYTHNVQEGKGKVIVFDPEQNGHCYNPIRECNTVDSCQFLARTLIPTPQGADPFWTGNAQNILAAACYEANKEGKTLPQIAERILLTDAQTLVDELTNSKYREVQLLSSSVKGTPEKTLGGIFTELKGKMILFATDPNIKQALSKSDWTAETLEEGATIYLRVSERQIETYKQVWNLIIVQIIRHLASRPEHKSPPILLLFDELARLGKVEGYSSALTTLRSKEVTIVTAIQSLAQLQEHYGKEVTRTIMDSNSYKLVLSASDNETQKVFSDLAGKSEIRKKSASYSFHGGGISEHDQWEERFRPENFAYLKRPIFYTPDKEAFEVDKAFWMNINYFIKLQRKHGGPLGFMKDEEILEHSTFKNINQNHSVNLEKVPNKNIAPEELDKVLQKENEGNSDNWWEI